MALLVNHGVRHDTFGSKGCGVHQQQQRGWSPGSCFASYMRINNNNNHTSIAHNVLARPAETGIPS